MAILKTTKEIIIEESKKIDQSNYQQTLLALLDHLSTNDVTEEELIEWSRSLVNSFDLKQKELE